MLYFHSKFSIFHNLFYIIYITGLYFDNFFETDFQIIDSLLSCLNLSFNF